MIEKRLKMYSEEKNIKNTCDSLPLITHKTNKNPRLSYGVCDEKIWMSMYIQCGILVLKKRVFLGTIIILTIKNVINIQLDVDYLTLRWNIVVPFISSK